MIILLMTIALLSEQEYIDYIADLKEQNITIVQALPTINEEEFVDFDDEDENNTP